ncbi:phage tail protein [Rivularia sp. UHCC 0363]|uniref:phage tail protein n=1 Tax=Rivularia sp. UHCC 0363 TaxID=3110244 RepID=UPI002B200636|nr:phage tail protein [Rivularia sp. UHCC 0363]MEA5598419.1 phage tail protein [Rivularia sp. UHCC 0363]
MADFEALASCKFFVELSLDNCCDKVDGVFLECQGFQRTQEVIEICEVTSNKFGKATNGMSVTRKIPGNAKNGNIILRRCMSSSIVFWDWFQGCHDNWAKQRRNVSLNILNSMSQGQARFELAGAWPISYRFGDVGAYSSGIALEEVEIAFEELKRVKS